MGIKVKRKKCKGTSKVGGGGCGRMVFDRRYGLCMGCYKHWLFNTPEGKATLKKATDKATKPRRELEKAAKEKKERESLSRLKRNVTNVVHKYIRLRDKGKTCISCGVDWKPDFQAGHLYKAELYSTLKYHEDNIHGQCMGCNLHKHGNESIYHDRLPKRIGYDKYWKLRDLALEDKQKNFKWDREELNKIRKKFQALIKKQQKFK